MTDIFMIVGEKKFRLDLNNVPSLFEIARYV